MRCIISPWHVLCVLVIATTFALAGCAKKQLPDTVAPSQQVSDKYVYTLNRREYDCFHSGHVNSTPILKAYIKWFREDANLDYGNHYVADGQYAFYHFNGNRAIMRLNLRTGDAAPFGNLKAPFYTIGGEMLLNDGTIYLRGNRAFNATQCPLAISTADGSVRETRTHGDQKCYGVSLVLPQDRLIVQIYDNKEPEIGCIEESTGRILWRRPGQGDTIVRCRERLICTGMKEIFALDLKDGHELWKTPLEDIRIDGTAFSDDKRVFVTALGSGLVALDGETGREIWRAKGLYGYVLDGKGHILAKFLGPSGPLFLLDTATGEIVAKLPVNLTNIMRLKVTCASWGYAMDAETVPGQPRRALGRIVSFNTETGESKILLDAREQGDTNPVGNPAVIDGYLITQSMPETGKKGWICLEDMRFHPDATKMLFDIRPGMLDDKMKARIAELIQKLGDTDWKVRKDATDELASLKDLPRAQLEQATKETVPPEIRFPAEACLRNACEWEKLRKYLDEQGCWRDPIYFTALIRHTADLAIQQKAIDRLKKITGQDFGLKPSAEWVKDQKEASDKYDAWWQTNRDKLKWSDKDDKYISQ